MRIRELLLAEQDELQEPMASGQQAVLTPSPVGAGPPNLTMQNPAAAPTPNPAAPTPAAPSPQQRFTDRFTKNLPTSPGFDGPVTQSYPPSSPINPQPAPWANVAPPGQMPMMRNSKIGPTSQRPATTDEFSPQARFSNRFVK